MSVNCTVTAINLRNSRIRSLLVTSLIKVLKQYFFLSFYFKLGTTTGFFSVFSPRCNILLYLIVQETGPFMWTVLMMCNNKKQVTAVWIWQLFVCESPCSFLSSCPLQGYSGCTLGNPSFFFYDLHVQSLDISVEVGMYFAVDHVTTFYFDQVVFVDNRFVEFKFWSSTTNDRPRRDDMDRVHCIFSCVFYGPVVLEGNGHLHFQCKVKLRKCTSFSKSSTNSEHKKACGECLSLRAFMKTRFEIFRGLLSVYWSLDYLSIRLLGYCQWLA